MEIDNIIPNEISYVPSLYFPLFFFFGDSIIKTLGQRFSKENDERAFV